MDAYCVKCKSKRELSKKNGTLLHAKNGRAMIQAKCSKCGTKMTRFLSKAQEESFKK